MNIQIPTKEIFLLTLFSVFASACNTEDPANTPSLTNPYSTEAALESSVLMENVYDYEWNSDRSKLFALAKAGDEYSWNQCQAYEIDPNTGGVTLLKLKPDADVSETMKQNEIFSCSSLYTTVAEAPVEYTFAEKNPNMKEEKTYETQNESDYVKYTYEDTESFLERMHPTSDLFYVSKVGKAYWFFRIGDASYTEEDTALTKIALPSSLYITSKDGIGVLLVDGQLRRFQ